MGRGDVLATRHPRTGVEQWRNPLNGLVVVQLHYTADPAKRGAEWKARTSRGMSPRAWRREYEIDWASPEGEPVVPEYQDAVHCIEFPWDRGVRLLRGWDFGYVSPVVLFAQLTWWNQLRVFQELCPFNTPLNQLLPAVRAISIELCGLDLDSIDIGGQDEAGVEAQVDRALGMVSDKSRVFDAGDPAAFNQTDLGASAEVLGHYGYRLHTARPGTEVSYAGLRRRFLAQVMDPQRRVLVPSIVIHPRCANLRKALGGVFHLSLMPPHRPVKLHPAKDLVDALRYLEDNLRDEARETKQALRTLASGDIRELRSAR